MDGAQFLSTSFRGARWREPGISRFRVRCCASPRNDNSLAFKAFVADDLDAVTGQSLVVVHRRRQVSDRAYAEVAQNLRADADFAPLLVAIGLCRFLFADGFDGN